MEIEIHSEVTEISDQLPAYRDMISWVCRRLDIRAKSIHLIFVSDDELRELHRRYLNDGNLTDIITFDLGEPGAPETELYISIDRAREHAIQYEVPLSREIARLIIHGFLHIAGFDDREEKKSLIMKKEEERFLEEATSLYTI